jgi:hypothetical protein
MTIPRLRIPRADLKPMVAEVKSITAGVERLAASNDKLGMLLSRAGGEN